MKKLLTLLFISMMLIGVAGCSNEKEGPAEKPAEVTTIGDLLRGDYTGFEFTDEYFLIETEDMIYEITMNPELNEKLNAVDFMAEDRDEQYAEILSEYPIEKETKKADLALSEEQLAAYVGQSGQVLIDDGFSISGSMYDDDKVTFLVSKDHNDYTVVCEGKVENNEDAEMEEVLAQMTISSIVPGWNY